MRTAVFAEELRRSCTAAGLRPRYLSAERLAGLEKQNYSFIANSQIGQGYNIGHFATYKSHSLEYGLSSDAYVLLKEKLDLRIKVEATLSTLFGRQLRLAEEGGYLIPKIQPLKGGQEYDVREHECHGLKELIPILTYLYDDEHNCLILDEPEVHLHPQYQTWLMQEIRRLSGNPLMDMKKKQFFIITHSPYFIDIRTIEDLNDLLVFRPGAFPICYSSSDQEDFYRISKLIPRLNVHHKQLFFCKSTDFC